MVKFIKIFIFATFQIFLFCSLTRASDLQKMQKRDFLIYYHSGDSLLAEYLLQNIDQPLKKIESFFVESLNIPVSILIVKSDKEFMGYFGNRIPEWSQAIAIPNERMIVLKLSNSDQIREGPRILLHEIVHILVFDFLKGAPLPTWLNEGLAQYFSEGDLTLQQKIVLAQAIVENKMIDLMAMDTLFRFSTAKARLAYIEAQSAVDFLATHYGLVRLKKMLLFLRHRQTLNQAFQKTYGFDFLDFEIQWNEYIYAHYRWLVLLKIEEWLFVLMALLFLLAVLVVYVRNKKKLRAMEEEEMSKDIMFNNLDEGE